MVRWLIQDSDDYPSMNRRIHPYFNNLMQLRKKGMDQASWIGVSHESFSTFLSQSQISLENIEPNALKGVMREMVKTPFPPELKRQVHQALVEQQLIDSRLELELLVHWNGDCLLELPWDTLCSISTKGLDGVFQSIKACWAALFRPGVISSFATLGLDINKLQISILIKPHQTEVLRGKAFSFSPRSPWDRRYSVVTYDKQSIPHSFLVDRSTLSCTYYGKNTTASLKTIEPVDISAYDIVKKVTTFLQHCEKLLENALQIEWIMSSDQRIHLTRIQFFDHSPSAQQLAPQFNTTTRNIWDHGMIHWNSMLLLKPFWFSLIPRNFRILSIHYVKALGIKNKLTAEYEKIFRGLWGILRGRLYVNLGALHSFLSLGESQALAEEVEVNVSLWLKRYDHESREAWNLQWPQPFSYSTADRKKMLKNTEKLLKNWPEKISNWIDQMHSLREALVSTQWKDKNVSVMLNAFQDWEKQYIPGLVPLLIAELQYRNLLSWHCEGAQKTLLDQASEPSWNQVWYEGASHAMPVTELNWFARRHKQKLYEQLETLNQMRPKYLSMLEDVYAKLRRFFEVMGQKYQAMGLIEKSEDVFYLTFEELLSFEEGRSTTTDWKKLALIRQEEYRRYSHDTTIPETWFTTGLVGLAAQYPAVISIKEKKTPERAVPFEFNISSTNHSYISSESHSPVSAESFNIMEKSLASEANTKNFSLVEMNKNSKSTLSRLDFIEDEVKPINSSSFVKADIDKSM